MLSSMSPTILMFTLISNEETTVKLSVKARMQLPGTTEGVGWTVGSTVPQ